MTTWMISANVTMYDHAGSFAERGFIDWRQHRNFNVGDIIYIYYGKPVKRIGFKTVVENTEMTSREIVDDREFWNDLDEYRKGLKHNRFVRIRLLETIDKPELDLYHLLDNGLSAAPQGGIKLDGMLLEYIENYVSHESVQPVFPEADMPDDAYEGAKKQVTVNKYERNAEARRKCIEYFGCKCIVCGMNFGERYGEIGEGFIHVHHVVPLNEIDEEYKVDYRTDLIPVCPNCHAMLHRKINGRNPTFKELQRLYRDK